MADLEKDAPPRDSASDPDAPRDTGDSQLHMDASEAQEMISFSSRYTEPDGEQAAAAPDDGSDDGGSVVGSIDAVLESCPPDSAAAAAASIPDDDSVSVQGSVTSATSSRIGHTPRPFRPFDRRFQSRLASPSFLSNIGSDGSRPTSPAFVESSHGRTISSISQSLPWSTRTHLAVLPPPHHQGLTRASSASGDDTETSSPPWDVVRWTKLSRLDEQVFSDQGRRSFGTPTCCAVSALIALGTTNGLVLVFDHGQSLKAVVGAATRAVECGAVTALALSSDCTMLGAGHADGSIFTWDLGRASKPFLQIPPLEEEATSRAGDGHVPDVAITHIGFLGTRRTALVSADDRGMAFSHLATRGTGSLGRTVRTTRILGRYPGSLPPPGKPYKPSTVLAFAPLPLGNFERATDTMGLTAMLTPYLLVIVSTTPIAQTQHKTARPRDMDPHTAITGCLAWFPAVKPKQDTAEAAELSRVKLAYCWSNILTVLDVDEVPSDDKDKPPSLKFKARSRWKCDEAVVAVQWISRSAMTVLTITQRLIVLQDWSMRPTDSLDLLGRQIYHADLFSEQLRPSAQSGDDDEEEADALAHGIVGDAFFMSLKTYKGRLFILGLSQLCVGTLTSWHHRLVALMEHGDYVGAIRLATSYYTGDADRLTVGLPENVSARHAMVREKLMEIMTASLRFAFEQQQQQQHQRGQVDVPLLDELAQTCFVACLSVDRTDFLFGQVFDWYEEGSVPGIFLEALEPYILDRTITSVPPTVMKAVVGHYVERGWESRMEEMICHLETAALDLDQVTQLCKAHGLYDALCYVWNQALGDYITPLTELLKLLFLPDPSPSGHDGTVHALKIFPYLSYTLTGRVYPTGEALEHKDSLSAKSDLYWFLFSGKAVAWPRGSGLPFRTRQEDDEDEDEGDECPFPYLRLVLHFDAASFLSVLNEAFEDPFLNTEDHDQAVASEARPFGMTIDRQYVVSVLLEVMSSSEFDRDDRIYLDMFVARNLPKFPQYLLLPSSTLAKVLDGLCRFPGPDLAADAQLSAEYLLSVYKPHDTVALVPMLKAAGFYRVLKRILAAEKQYSRLVEAYFDDPDDRDGVFACIVDSLRVSTLAAKQRRQIIDVVRAHSRDLLETDAPKAALALESQPARLHHDVLDAAGDAPRLQYDYLQALMTRGPEGQDDGTLVERYIRLMCRFEPDKVSDYIGVVGSADLRLDELLPTMEESGIVDAAVVLMAKDGRVKEAMGRLVKHLGVLESAMAALLAGPEGEVQATAGDDGVERPAEDVLASLQKYVHVGIWLCQSQAKPKSKRALSHRGRLKKDDLQDPLSDDEVLWLDLIEAAVRVTRRLSPAISSARCRLDQPRLVGMLRALVQHAFTSLLTSTSADVAPTPTPTPHRSGPPHLAPYANVSFLRILRAFLANMVAASPALSDLRAVLQSIFSAYAYEESILRLSSRLLEKSLFVSVGKAATLRQRGWRPKGSTCEGCGQRVWGAGVSGNVYEQWEQRRLLGIQRQRQRQSQSQSQMQWQQQQQQQKGQGNDKGKGKGKCADAGAGGPDDNDDDDDDKVRSSDRDGSLGPLVLLACRHIYHQKCLVTLQGERTHGKEYKCPVDG